jgi:aryl-alcohol dehydrogenase-like predicted oxidoreductase
MEQPEYNLFNRQKVEFEFLPLYEKFGLGTTIWSPLASGILTGKYNRAIPDDSRMNLPEYGWLRASLQSPEGAARIEKVKKLELLAKEIGCSLTHLSLAWCLAHSYVSSVILGASKRSQLEENLKALEVVPRLNSEVMAQIDKVMENQPLPLKNFKE